MTTKRRARLWAALILAVAGASANSGYPSSSGVAEAASAAAHVDTGALTATLPDAALSAQASFDRFLSGATLHTRTGPESAVRVRKPGAEPVWLFGVTRTGTGFSGHPAGLDERIAFDRSQIVDWSHTAPDGRVHGNFAARAMMGVLPPHRSALIAATLALDPLPSGW